MSIRVQKRWQQVGAPTAPGDVEVRDLGEIVDISAENIALAAELGGNPNLVLEHVDADGFISQWKIIEMRAD